MDRTDPKIIVFTYKSLEVSYDDAFVKAPSPACESVDIIKLSNETLQLTSGDVEASFLTSTTWQPSFIKHSWKHDVSCIGS